MWVQELLDGHPRDKHSAWNAPACFLSLWCGWMWHACNGSHSNYAIFHLLGSARVGSNPAGVVTMINDISCKISVTTSCLDHLPFFAIFRVIIAFPPASPEQEGPSIDWTAGVTGPVAEAGGGMADGLESVGGETKFPSLSKGDVPSAPFPSQCRIIWCHPLIRHNSPSVGRSFFCFYLPICCRVGSQPNRV
ncbi:hypothetical protein NEOLEDRAFT_670850 [Neolentinus lepideus HHB14362 ss-1]|uniref:Uncharacterized protein n=1 Tax=Neolentinus lepideus HHB14362 ss-1 TaxID=1314782 RepID=A0A165QB58_9AGAM|nr:hypothetical protein NEOLEDRAFT_670850 [Neolentinus lepideus HHB14362 ss-1]